jgi:hypothetical protein
MTIPLRFLLRQGYGGQESYAGQAGEKTAKTTCSVKNPPTIGLISVRKSASSARVTFRF